MPRLNQDSITDQVYELLNRDIEAGRFEPGTRIFEEALARDLGISKTPLRLALHQLRRDGVVRIKPRRGIYLAAPTRTELIELIELREVLEGLAARCAAGQPDERCIDRLEGCLAGFTERNLRGRRAEYAAADHRFHTLLAQAAGSAELAKMLQVINIRLHAHRLDRTANHDLRPIHREHLSIIKAVRTRDAERAEELARRHVRHQLALKMLRDSETKSERSHNGQNVELRGSATAIRVADDVGQRRRSGR